MITIITEHPLKESQEFYNGVVNRLISLNNLYGKGDIIQVDFIKSRVTAKLQYGESVRTFRITNESVHFCYHQSNWRKELRI